MKRGIAALAGLVALAACQGTPHPPGEFPGATPGWIRLYNGGSTPIVGFSVRETGTTEWERWGSPALPSGSAMEFGLTGRHFCLVDVRIETTGGETAEYLGVDACNPGSIRFPKDQ